MFRFFIVHFSDGDMIKAQDGGLRAGEKNGRMRGNNELSVTRLAYLHEQIQELELSFRREGRFRFIQQVESFYLITGIEKGHDGLTVRLGH